MKIFPLSDRRSLPTAQSLITLFENSVLDSDWARRFVGTDVVFDVREVADHADELSDAECEAVAKAVMRRRNTYSSGRACARAALLGIGVSRAQYPVGLLKQDDGSVGWPPGTTGSISHTNEWAIAAAASAGQGVVSLGIDLEVIQRLKSPILDTIATTDERARLAQDHVQGWQSAALFSIKESLYKCLRPHHGAFIGFRDVELSIPTDALNDGSGVEIYQPSIRFLSAALIEQFDERRLRARVAVIDGFVLSVVSYCDAIAGDI